MKKTPASREKPASRSEGGVEVRRHCDSASVLVDGEPRTPRIETGTKKDAGPRGWPTTESGARGGANGCLGRAETTVTVENTGKLPIVAPKMFSPNGDLNNDFWVITGIQNFPECRLTVFTRNGKIVLETVAYQDNWQGLDLEGTEMPEGAYYYTISCPDGLTASGSVSIIR